MYIRYRRQNNRKIGFTDQTPVASLNSWMNPDFWERSSTKRLVPATALFFFWDQKNFDPSSCSLVSQEFVRKPTVISFGVLFVLVFFVVALLTFVP